MNVSQVRSMDIETGGASHSAQTNQAVAASAQRAGEDGRCTGKAGSQICSVAACLAFSMATGAAIGAITGVARDTDLASASLKGAIALGILMCPVAAHVVYCMDDDDDTPGVHQMQ